MYKDIRSQRRLEQFMAWLIIVSSIGSMVPISVDTVNAV
jgi:hypothetical protein